MESKLNHHSKWAYDSLGIARQQLERSGSTKSTQPRRIWVFECRFRLCFARSDKEATEGFALIMANSTFKNLSGVSLPVSATRHGGSTRRRKRILTIDYAVNLWNVWINRSAGSFARMSGRMVGRFCDLDKPDFEMNGAFIILESQGV